MKYLASSHADKSRQRILLLTASWSLQAVDKYSINLRSINISMRLMCDLLTMESFGGTNSTLGLKRRLCYLPERFQSTSLGLAAQALGIETYFARLSANVD